MRISYNTGKSALPDIICMTPKGECVYIWQVAKHESDPCIITNICYTFGTLKIFLFSCFI